MSLSKTRKDIQINKKIHEKIHEDINATTNISFIKVIIAILIIGMFLLIAIILKIGKLRETQEKQEIIEYNKIRSLKDQQDDLSLFTKPKVKNVFTNMYEVININTATKEKLKTLTGIGDKMAEKIIEYRNENGNFKNVEELLKVNGIGMQKLKNIKKYVEV